MAAKVAVGADVAVGAVAEAAALTALTVVFTLPLLVAVCCAGTADGFGAAAVRVEVAGSFCEDVVNVGAMVGCTGVEFGRDLRASAAVGATKGAVTIVAPERCVTVVAAAAFAVDRAVDAEFECDCLLAVAAAVDATVTFRPDAPDLVADEVALLRLLDGKAETGVAFAVDLLFPLTAVAIEAGAADAKDADEDVGADMVEKAGIADSVAAAAVAFPLLLVVDIADDLLLLSQAAGVGFALQLTRGNICRMSTSGSLINAVMR